MHADNKMATSVKTWVIQCALIEFLMVEGCVPTDTHLRITVVYGGYQDIPLDIIISITGDEYKEYRNLEWRI